MKTLLTNKKAYREYEIKDKIEAGIKLMGMEVKSLKEGRGSLRGTHIRYIKNDLALIGMELPRYSKTGENIDYNSRRDRILLVNKREKLRILQFIDQKGGTSIPLKIYIQNNLIKVLIGLCIGKKQYNKKADIIKKTQTLDMNRAIKEQRFN